MLGSWYTPREIGKRAMVFWLAGSIGQMFSGFLQAAAVSISKFQLLILCTTHCFSPQPRITSLEEKWVKIYEAAGHREKETPHLKTAQMPYMEILTTDPNSCSIPI